MSQGVANTAKSIRRTLCILAVVVGSAGMDPALAQSRGSQDLNAINGRINALHAARRYKEAEPLADQVLAITRASPGRKEPRYLVAYSNAGLIFMEVDRLADAEAAFREGLQRFRTGVTAGGDNNLITITHNLATLYLRQKRFDEAEPLMRSTIAEYEKRSGPDSVAVANGLNNLASLYEQAKRYAEGEPLASRAVRIFERHQHPTYSIALSNLAQIQERLGRNADAEANYRRAIEINEKRFGRDSPALAIPLNNLAVLLGQAKRHAEAEAVYARALGIVEKATGSDNAIVAQLHHNLGGIQSIREQHETAQRSFARAAEIRTKLLGRNHPDTAKSLAQHATAAFSRGDNRLAYDGSLQALEIAIEWLTRNAAIMRQQTDGDLELQLGPIFTMMHASERLIENNPQLALQMSAVTFETAQWARSSEAANSLAQMAMRGAAGESRLGSLVRERQDLATQWTEKDGRLIAELAKPAASRQPLLEQGLRREIDATDARRKEIDRVLEREFPQFASFSSSEALSGREVQSLLREGEALVLISDVVGVADAPSSSFVWVVTKNTFRRRAAPGLLAHIDEAVALRCGLDAARWQGESRKDCLEALKLTEESAPKGDGELPFDLDRAHKLYVDLFGEFDDLIRDKHLLVVPSRMFSVLPLQVLVTQKPEAGPDAYRKAAWFGTRNPITILPAVSSLKALRADARPSGARRAMIGFGNPLLDGGGAESAALARAKQQCATTAGSATSAQRMVRAPAASPFRGGKVDATIVRAQTALPETADELCSVARDLGVPDSDIKLGANATEREVKRLSAGGDLSAYRILHFATHGALAGEIQAGAEPGLLLTPPAQSNAEDDGYLAASEIAALKLDADWVVLSACNTAGSAAKGGDPLSGLARAFFYAGARALLVSHWAVDSEATVALVSKAMAGSADGATGRAEALRQSMAALIATGKPHQAHPTYWAPFVVVGEGGR